MIDHLVLAGPDLAKLCEWWEVRTGTVPTPGGAHDGLGTRNALVGLGPNTYLELIGPDPDQPDPEGPRSFGIDDLHEITLVTWAASVDDLESAVAEAITAGVDAGTIRSMGRTRPDGVALSWRLAVPSDSTLDGVMPFLIEWGSDTPHPAASLDSVGSISEVVLVHPQAELLSPIVEAHTGYQVTEGEEPKIEVTIDLGDKTLTLR